MSGKVNCPEGFVVFDNVFVPNERVFLDGETAHAATLSELVRAVGARGRTRRRRRIGRSRSRHGGVCSPTRTVWGEDPRIKDQLASLVVYATMCRAAGESAMVNATKTEDGNMLPSPLFVSALKYFKSEFRARLLDIQHDIAGDLLVNAPTVGDFEHPDLHAALGEAFEVPGFTAEDRLRLFHYVRDTTADAYGGWAFVTGQLAGGGQHAQRIVTMRQYNMEHAKKSRAARSASASSENPARRTGNRSDAARCRF